MSSDIEKGGSKDGLAKGALRWLRGVLRPFGLLRENLKSLIAFEVIFRLLAFLVLFPILTWAQRLWLIGNRTKVIAWYNAKHFFMNPITWIVFLMMILQLAAAALFEQFATYENIERIHRAGKHVFVWTVNEENTMQQLVSLNVDAILTNSPDLCREVIEEYGSGAMNVLRRIQSAFSFL